MEGPNLRRIVLLATIAVVLFAGLQETVNAQLTTGPVDLYDCPPDANGNVSPPTNCNRITPIPTGSSVAISCRTTGAEVNGDYWWLYVYYGGYSGYVTDYYVDCGGGYCSAADC